MALLPILLLIVSASFHALWNLHGKRSGPSAAFMLAANSLGCLLLFPSLFIHQAGLPVFSSQVWLYLALTGLFQAIYYAALAGAYQNGDLSVAYPLARSLPVLLVSGLTQLLGIGKPLGPWAILGMVLVVAGCLIVPLKRFSDLHWSNYWRPACLLALLAAFGTAGYSIVDSQALGLLRQFAGQNASSFLVTTRYAFWEGITSSFWLGLFVLLRHQERRVLSEFDRNNLRQSALVGAGIYMGYLLVLLAMGMVSNVSYVVAFRQLSIPLGALLGVLALKEAPHPPKFVGVGVTFAGLLFVGFS